MLDRLCVRSHDTTERRSLDLGMFAEQLLFYNHVELVVNHVGLEQLLRGVGHRTVVALIDEGYLGLTYHTLGVGTAAVDGHHPGGHTVYAFAAMHSPSHELQDEAPRIMREITGRSGLGRTLGVQLKDRMRSVRTDGRAVDATMNLVRDPELLVQVARTTLADRAPGYQQRDPVRFEADFTADGLLIETNIDFAAATRAYHAGHPDADGDLTVSALLAPLAESQVDLVFAVDLDAELGTRVLAASLLEQTCKAIIRPHLAHSTDIVQFQQQTLSGRDVRSAVNGGHRTWDEMLELLRRAKRFREWSEGEPFDARLLDAYYAEVTRSSWVGSLPSRVVRFGICTAVGVVAPPAGLALGAFDQLITERLVRGWRPNQFVEGSLQQFVE